MAAQTPKKTPARKTARKRPAAVAGPGLEELRFSIESAFERRAALTLDEIDGSTRPLVERVIGGLESGQLRVAEPDGAGGWQVNEWLKKAVLLYFRVNDMAVMEGAPAPYWDKVATRFEGYGEAEFRKLGVRVVPGTVARRGRVPDHRRARPAPDRHRHSGCTARCAARRPGYPHLSTSLQDLR